MNRRNFIRGALALPFAAVGAPGRFLVGRYGAPDAAAMVFGAASIAGMFAALPLLLDFIEREAEAQKKVKESIMKDAIQALNEAVPCGEPS